MYGIFVASVLEPLRHGRNFNKKIYLYWDLNIYIKFAWIKNGIIIIVFNHMAFLYAVGIKY